MIHILKEEGHSISEIARRLSMDRKTVRTHLAKGLEPPRYHTRPPVQSLLQPYRAYLAQNLESCPGISARRLLREIKEMGYQGSYTLLTDYLPTIRPSKPIEFEKRFETAPGKQAQVDFARFSTRFRSEPDVERVVWLFSMVLGSSRYLYGYIVIVSAVDNAGNFISNSAGSTSWTAKRFNIDPATADTSPPTASISNPATTNAALNESPILSGTATDTGGSGFSHIRIGIKDRNTNLWYNASNGTFGAWIPQLATLANTSDTQTDWSLPTILPAGSYIVIVSAVDNAGNYASNSAGSTSWTAKRFTIDAGN